jgi:RNA recognition motif-containing protein
MNCQYYGVQVRIAFDPATQRSRGYAFVTMETTDGSRDSITGEED